MQTISGNTIILRPITEKDTDNILKWRNRDSVRKNFIYQKILTREEHLNWLSEKVFTGSTKQFIIVMKEGAIPIGSVYIRVYDTNSIAIRSYEKAGFKQEAQLKEPRRKVNVSRRTNISQKNRIVGCRQHCKMEKQ